MAVLSGAILTGESGAIPSYGMSDPEPPRRALPWRAFLVGLLLALAVGYVLRPSAERTAPLTAPPAGPPAAAESPGAPLAAANSGASPHASEGTAESAAPAPAPTEAGKPAQTKPLA